MKREYVFDDAELRRVIDLAFKHGTVHGWTFRPGEKRKHRDNQLFNARADFGAILNGDEPWYD